MKDQRLSPTAIHQAIETLNAGLQHPWTTDGDALHKAFRFADFVDAFRFMAGCALIAERMDHHPDWCNGYNRVEVTLSTHDAGGVTEKDLTLARAMQGLAGPDR